MAAQAPDVDLTKLPSYASVGDKPNERSHTCVFCKKSWKKFSKSKGHDAKCASNPDVLWVLPSDLKNAMSDEAFQKLSNLASFSQQHLQLREGTNAKSDRKP